jgi:hypothetical protein
MGLHEHRSAYLLNDVSCSNWKENRSADPFYQLLKYICLVDQCFNAGSAFDVDIFIHAFARCKKAGGIWILVLGGWIL